MKTYLVAFLFFCLSANAYALDVSVYPAVFYESNHGYVEVHYYFSGPSIGWTTIRDSLMQSGAEVLITFELGDKIIKYDKYNIRSPQLTSASDFRDVHRYSLKPGKYIINIKIIDLSRKSNSVKFSTQTIIDPPTTPTISDIVLLSNVHESNTQTPFDKYGQYMEALPFNFVNKNTSKFAVYAEVYHTDQLNTDDYTLRLQFETIDGGKKMPYQGFSKKRKTKDKDIYIKTLDAKFMPTGDYNLVLEVRDAGGSIITKNAVAFHRDNPRVNTSTTIADLNGKKGNFIEKLTQKELDYYLTALLPLVTGTQSKLLNSALNNKNLEAQKQFLYGYFVKKDPIQPSVPFYTFADLAHKVDKAYYNAFGHGFETDRGRIYLKYGAPNDQIKVEDEHFAYPYEIWVYEKLPNNSASPVKFMFYNPDRSGENYSLLHSNARGERQDRKWKTKLFKEDTMSGFDHSNNRLKNSEVDDALNSHPNSMAIRYFQDL